jgi:hypothetical protein
MRYVVLHHTGWKGRENHYDLLLELPSGEARLKTFSTLQDIFPATGSELKLISPHRRAYLDYTGPVSGGRGFVTREDEGELAKCAESKELSLEFSGKRLLGRFRLRSLGAGKYILEPLMQRPQKGPKGRIPSAQAEGLG